MSEHDDPAIEIRDLSERVLAGEDPPAEEVAEAINRLRNHRRVSSTEPSGKPKSRGKASAPPPDLNELFKNFGSGDNSEDKA